MGMLRFPALLFVLALCGCAGAPWTPIASQQEAEASPPKAASRSTQVARSTSGEAADLYKLDAGDRVRVVVAGDDALSGSYEISPGGMIDIPSVGTIAARGLNTVQLSAAIARQLKQHDKRDVHVAVQVETYRPFTIRGAVANPGQYPYVNNMTAETAIAIAGGLKPGAEQSALIVSSAQGGRGPASLDTPVRPGDTVTVAPER
ncbi:MAG TPA: polysaccharide biosynthesis/export family protein [Xanthobacteraceae bacterium]|nr:polysaccharide biosynthesis/export family protein [Xanthobacteraceae bacterium]